MTFRIITADTLRANVSFHDLIEPVSQAFQKSSAGLAENGLIVMFPLSDKAQGDVYVKTGTLRGHDVFIVKVSPWFAANVVAEQPQGGFLGVFDSYTGKTLALIDEQHYLSDIRTAAAGAVAARLLTRKDASRAAIVGSGVQAFWQAQALCGECEIETLTLWARDVAKAEALRKRLTPLLPTTAIEVNSDLEATVVGSDVIVTTTLSREPIIRGEWLQPGQHITAVGADDPMKCELDGNALKRARVFVDAMNSATANGDIYRAIVNDGYRGDRIAGEIGAVLAGTLAGRQNDDDITIAKFVGIGAQDLLAAEVILRTCLLD
jgi:ornithine cyclodeaminase/alanine dehydrogenase-like protein (mu-crystallin family)